MAGVLVGVLTATGMVVGITAGAGLAGKAVAAASRRGVGLEVGWIADAEQPANNMEIIAAVTANLPDSITSADLR
jgi:hypothetical protein